VGPAHRQHGIRYHAHPQDLAPDDWSSKGGHCEPGILLGTAAPAQPDRLCRQQKVHFVGQM